MRLIGRAELRMSERSKEAVLVGWEDKGSRVVALKRFLIQSAVVGIDHDAD